MDAAVRSYSSNLALTDPTCMASFTDDHLIWLAAKGYEDMLAKYKVDYPNEDKVPGAMVVFAPVGENKVYLGSSVRGVTAAPEKWFVHPVVISWFQSCEVPHRTCGSCGEFSVLQSYFDTHETPDCMPPPQSRIVAWVHGRLVAPCPDGAEGIGCETLVKDFKLTAIKPDTPGIKADKKGIAPDGFTFVGANDRNKKEWVTVKKKGKRKC